MDNRAQALTYFRNGVLAAMRGAVRTAIACFDSALKYDSTLIEAMYDRGYLMMQSGNLQSAEADFRAVLVYDNDHRGALLNLGVVLGRADCADDALAISAAAVNMLPNDIAIRFNFGCALEDCEQYWEAAEQYRAILDIDCSYVPAQINLGHSLALAGDLPSGIKAYNRALELDQSDPTPHYGLGLIFNQLGDADKAIAHFREAVRRRPLDIRYRSLLGVSLVARGRSYHRIVDLIIGSFQLVLAVTIKAVLVARRSTG